MDRQTGRAGIYLYTVELAVKLMCRRLAEAEVEELMPVYRLWW